MSKHGQWFQRILFAMGFLAACDTLLAEAPVHWVTWRQDPCRSLIVSWVTAAKEKRDARLWYRAERAEGDVSEWQEMRGTVSAFPFLGTATLNHAELTGLAPGTTYRLAWTGPTDRGGAEARVTTMPETLDSPVTFIVAGDAYCHEFRTGGVTAKLAHEAGRWNPHFVMIPGNVGYASDDEESLGHRWLEWLTVWAGAMKSQDGRTIPLLVTIGDHEVKGFTSQPVARAASYYRLFPTTGIRGYSAIDFGNYLSVFLLDSGHTNPMDGGQRDWLEAALASRSGVSHRIVAYHRSVVGSAGIEIESASNGASHNWPTLFDRFGVQAVFENDSRFGGAASFPGAKPGAHGARYFGSPARTTDNGQTRITANECGFIVGRIFSDRQEYRSVALEGRLIESCSIETAAIDHSAAFSAELPTHLSASTARNGEPQTSSSTAHLVSSGDTTDARSSDSDGNSPVSPARPTWIRRPTSGKSLHVPGEFASIRAAVDAAEAGDTIKIAPGDYREPIVIDKPISLVGSGPLATRLHGLDKTLITDFAVKIRRNCDAAIAELTVGDGYRGIVVEPSGRLDVRHTYITDNTRDGIYMESGRGDVHTYLYMERCLVSGTADGVDFMGGQGFLLDCIFRDNSDDGVDFDGDAGVVVYGCVFSNNRDDGIEVRLKQRTYIYSIDNVFDQNGEDGFEVIDTFLPEGGIYNVISLQNNRFYENRRYGISFVDQKTEKDGNKPVSSAVYIGPNEYSKPGQANVTDNYRNAVDLAGQTPDRVTVTIGSGNDAVSSEHRLVTPLLVGVYDLKSMSDGSHCSDTEDVAVSSTRVYVPDDDRRMIYVLDRLNGDLLNKIPLTPIRGSQHSAKGPEGVHVIEGPNGDEKLWVSDDDGLAIYLLSLEADSYGRLLELQSTAELGPCEGVAVLGERMYLTRNNGLAIVPTIAQKKPVNPTIRISSNVFGNHVAGVSLDSTGTRLFATTNGYSPHEDSKISWRGRDKPSGVYELTPDMTEVKNVWNLGAFCDDLRGVAYRDRLLYAACGRQPYTDPTTGELVRKGEKVFVFVVDGYSELAAGHDTRAIKSALSYLPLRSGH